MLRQPRTFCEAGRSATLVKLKSFVTDEARVVGHEPGKGRSKGRLGATQPSGELALDDLMDARRTVGH